MTKKKFTLSNCPIHRSMGILGSKWKPIIIWALRQRTARFGQLAAAIGTISRKVLTTTLRELESDGIVTRDVQKASALTVEYTLTEKGHDLIPLILKLVDWDTKHYRDIYFDQEQLIENAASEKMIRENVMTIS